jgi:hypothetical protein
MARTAISQIPTDIAKELTPKQREFLRLCVARGASTSDGVMMQCYLDAGFKVNIDSARSCGNRLLRSVHAKAYLAELHRLKEDAAVERMKREWLESLEERRVLAHYDPADLYDEEGNLLPLKDMPSTVRKAITGVRMNKKGTKLIGVQLDKKHQHLDVIEDKYSLMPDNKRIPEKLEISGGLTVEALQPRDQRLKIIDDVIARWEAEKAGAEKVTDTTPQASLPAHESPGS